MNINCRSKPIRRTSSSQNLTEKKEPHRSQSFSKMPDEPLSQSKKARIQELEKTLKNQSEKLKSLNAENSKLSNMVQEISEKEQKILKKQNVLSLKSNADDSKHKALKVKSEDLSKQIEELLKTLETVSKVDKGQSSAYKNSNLLCQLEKDVKVNKELRFLFKVLSSKIGFAKAKKAIKKQLSEKQSHQIASIEKIISFMLNKVETLEDINILSSVNLNSLKKQSFEVGKSLCDIKGYCKVKNQEISNQIIEEKNCLESFQALCRKGKEKQAEVDIKGKNLKVLQRLCGGHSDKELLKNKQEVLENLQEMLKFWIQEYSKVSMSSYEDEELES